MAVKKKELNGNGHAETNRIADLLPPTKTESLSIKPLRQTIMRFKLTGASPFMQLRFSLKAMNKMMATQQAGSVSKSKKVREARDFDDDFEQAKHKFEDGTCGIPAAAFRCAMISACRTVGFKMTLAKLSVFVEADGLDVVDGTPLVRIHGTPEKSIMQVRNATGVCDLRSRPLWREWTVELRVRFDADQFSATDCFNLLRRAGMQVGVGEGRPDSKASAGLGYGLFDVELIEAVNSDR